MSGRKVSQEISDRNVHPFVQKSDKRCYIIYIMTNKHSLIGDHMLGLFFLAFMAYIVLDVINQYEQKNTK